MHWDLEKYTSRLMLVTNTALLRIDPQWVRRLLNASANVHPRKHLLDAFKFMNYFQVYALLGGKPLYPRCRWSSWTGNHIASKCKRNNGKHLSVCAVTITGSRGLLFRQCSDLESYVADCLTCQLITHGSDENYDTLPGAIRKLAVFCKVGASIDHWIGVPPALCCCCKDTMACNWICAKWWGGSNQ